MTQDEKRVGNDLVIAASRLINILQDDTATWPLIEQYVGWLQVALGAADEVFDYDTV